MTDRTLREKIAALLTDAPPMQPAQKLVWHLAIQRALLVIDLDAHTAEQPSHVDVSEGGCCCHQPAVALADNSQQPAPDVAAEADAWRDVLAERQRQISEEGWDDIHDDMNDRGELAQAAACYALSGTPADEAVFIHGRWKDPRGLFWPHSWDKEWWKPTDRRRDLVKAGALILAEIERLDRIAKGTRP